MRAYYESVMALNVEIARRRFTVGEYERMFESGVLNPDDRVELIHGEVVQKMPPSNRHTAYVAALHELFVRRLGDRALVRSAGAVKLPPWSAPEPDVVLLRRRDDFYRTVDTASGDVLLAVEVADSSLRYDRDVKMSLYAESGIREAWVVDLADDAVDVYRTPASDGYRYAARVTRGQSVSPEMFPDLVVSLSDFLG
jgi:Uma2 family endonuclease